MSDIKTETSLNNSESIWHFTSNEIFLMVIIGIVVVFVILVILAFTIYYYLVSSIIEKL